jgi:gamma-glutamylcyclotransferase (GGCT)/AIG2-like uncharacterized protein YtfP
MAEQLFIYGTLHPDEAPSEIRAAVQKLRHLGTGVIRGKLTQLDGFPGVVLNETGGTVRGSVFTLPSRHLFVSLDRYEEFDPHNVESSLFIRRKTTVRMDDGSQRECWVYEYQPNRQRIAS